MNNNNNLNKEVDQAGEGIRRIELDEIVANIDGFVHSRRNEGIKSEFLPLTKEDMDYKRQRSVYKLPKGIKWPKRKNDFLKRKRDPMDRRTSEEKRIVVNNRVDHARVGYRYQLSESDIESDEEFITEVLAGKQMADDQEYQWGTAEWNRRWNHGLSRQSKKPYKAGFY